MVEQTSNTVKAGGEYFEENKNSKTSRQVEQLTKEEIEKLEGAYDEDGFYKLKDGSFYDPVGFHYNKDGFDAVGGCYDEDGFYQEPKDAIPVHADKSKPLTHKQIERFEGEYDEDGFYILNNKCFYDPKGFFFDKNGQDVQGGYYDNHGIYVEGTISQKVEKDHTRGHETRPLLSNEIEKIPGEYDEQGFYQLDEGGFYDPHGYYFDTEGFDEIGGYYDDDDNYVEPHKKEEDDFYDQEHEENDYDEEAEKEEDKIEDPKAEIEQHVVPVEIWINQEKDQKSSHWLKISGMPSIFTEKNSIKFLKKLVPSINGNELTFEKSKQGRYARWNGTIWIKTSNRATMIDVLRVHLHRYPRYKIFSWLIQYPYDEHDGPGNSVPPVYNQSAKKKVLNPEKGQQQQQNFSQKKQSGNIETHEEEEFTMIRRPQVKQEELETHDEDDFTITKRA